MSILLEALKKSEQERQLGQTPTLQTSPDVLPRGDGSMNRWIILALCIMSASVMAWFGWQQFLVPEPSQTAFAEVQVQTGEEGAITQESTSKPRTMTEMYQENFGKRASAVATKPEQADTGPAQAENGTAQTESQPIKAEKPGERKNSFSQSVSSFSANGDPAKPAVKTAKKTVPAKRQTAPSSAAAGSRQTEPKSTRPAETGQEGQRPGIEPHISEPISYWELPQTIREGMPEIKITVLVYSENPGDRFLLANGQRVVEKEELDGGLVLDEIRKEGAVFLYRNYRFLVKG